MFQGATTGPRLLGKAPVSPEIAPAPAKMAADRGQPMGLRVC